MFACIETYYALSNTFIGATTKAFHGKLIACAEFKQNMVRSKILKDNARKDFENNRIVRDPLLIAQLLITGRDCLNKVQIKVQLTIKHFMIKICSMTWQARTSLIKLTRVDHDDMRM